MPSPRKQCHRSQDETGRESGGGPETEAWARKNKNRETEGERSTVDARGGQAVRVCGKIRGEGRMFQASKAAG